MNIGMIVQSPVTAKGRVTLPKAIRHHLRLKPGDRITFAILPDGRVMLQPAAPISRLRGILKKSDGKPVTIEEMDDATAEGAIERFQCSKPR